MVSPQEDHVAALEGEWQGPGCYKFYYKDGQWFCFNYDDCKERRLKVQWDEKAVAWKVVWPFGTVGYLSESGDKIRVVFGKTKGKIYSKK